MHSVQAYVLALPWPPLASLDTYHQLGRVRENVMFRHEDNFQGRLVLVSLDGSARSWAQKSSPAHQRLDTQEEMSEVQSMFEGSAHGVLTAAGDYSDNTLRNLEQDMEFYLRTLVEVMDVAAPYLEMSWLDTLRRWKDMDESDVETTTAAFPPAGFVEEFIPVPVKLTADTETELRGKFVSSAFEQISPWVRGE